MARPFISLTIALALAALPLAAGPGRAQSFDCSKATAADEHAVCASPTLSRLDDKMARAYQGAKRCAMMGMQGVLTDSQRQFLADRAACGADEACLTRTYKAQIEYLNEQKKAIGQGAC